MLKFTMPELSSPVTITPVAVFQLVVEPRPLTGKFVWRMPALGLLRLFAATDVPSPTMIVPSLMAVE